MSGEPEKGVLGRHERPEHGDPASLVRSDGVFIEESVPVPGL